MLPSLVAAFSGGTGVVGGIAFDLAAYVISTSAPNPTAGLGGIVIEDDGTLSRLEYDSTKTLAGTWATGVFDIADYDFQCEKTSGVSLDGPNAENTWHAGVDGIQFSNVRSTNGTDIGTFILHIRPSGGGADIDTATFTLTVIKESP